MNPRPNAFLKPLLTLAAASLCLVAPAPAPRAQSPAAPQAAAANVELIPSHAPGSVAAFPETFDAPPDTAPLLVYARLAEAAAPPGGQTWILRARLVESPAVADGAPPRKLLAFAVPQLPRGVYEVSYAGGGRRLATRILVEPQLLAARGLVSGNPGEEREVSFGIDTLHLAAEDVGVVERRVMVTLELGDASVAELAPGQTASKMAAADGFATWKIRLKAAGETMLTASAPDYTPAETRVVNSPEAPADSEAAKADKRADEAAKDADKEDEKARAARADVDRETAHLLFLQHHMSARMSRAPAGVSADIRIERDLKKSAERVGERRKDLAESSRELANAERREARLLGDFFEARAQAAGAGLAAVGPRLLSQSDLLPGDIILMRGVKPLSLSIRVAEAVSYGRLAMYSHSALYVGDGLIAEMLGDGYHLRPVAASIDGATHADVYRWGGLSRQQRDLVAAKGRTFRGTLYAERQIKVLAAVAVLDPAVRASGLAPGADLLAAAALLALPRFLADADAVSGGVREMICSEMVAYSYHHAGLPADFAGRWNVRYWSSLDSLVRTDDRSHDYTTPNSLAFSGLLEQAGRLK